LINQIVYIINVIKNEICFENKCIQNLIDIKNEIHIRLTLKIQLFKITSLIDLA